MRSHPGEVVASHISQLGLVLLADFISGKNEDFQQGPLGILQMDHPS